MRNFYTTLAVAILWGVRRALPRSQRGSTPYSATPTWEPGKKLEGGKYIIEGILGQGGFGITYLARDRKGAKVAIKVLTKYVNNPEKYEHTFKKEVDGLEKCCHPHIVNFLGKIKEENLQGIVMEFVEGETLFDLVDREGPLPEKEALKYIFQISQALAVVHENNLLHRDVKPSNIIICTNAAKAVLIDFGIAREFSPNVTKTHTVSISGSYSPFEQRLKKEKRGAFIDIYALAATLYFLLTGQEPIPAIERLKEDELEPPIRINPEIDCRINDAILKGMDMDFTVRPQSIQEWLFLLDPSYSNVRLVSSASKKGSAPDLLIIDSEIATAWNQNPQNVLVYGGETLASLTIEDLRSGKIAWESVRWIEAKDLLLDEFFFIDRAEIIPGGLFPVMDSPLLFEGEEITPLLPLNPILLEYFTPEELAERLKLTPIDDDCGSYVRVTFSLPLSGSHSESQDYFVIKEYPIEEGKLLPEVPVLEIWPNFQAEGWKEYYGFYYDAEYGEDTFQVNFPNTRDARIFQEGRATYQLVRLEEFPTYIECKHGDRNLGLILLAISTDAILPEIWTVGVDFGTSRSNVYINRKDIPEPLPLENLHRQIAETPVDTRLNVLFEYFIPEEFIPWSKPLPLVNVLTTRGQENDSVQQDRPFFDGRIYIPDLLRFKPQEDYIVTDLDLSPEKHSYTKLFLHNLALIISAIAVKNGVREIQWSLSYPSDFSSRDKNQYLEIWQDIVSKLNQTTGIQHICPDFDDSDYFRSESLAIAQYFKDEESLNLLNTTCINMRDGISDISIWEGNELVHQCSVQLAGRDLFSQFLELNPNFLEQRFKVDVAELRGLRGPAFKSKVDVLLRLQSQDWLNKRTSIADKSDFRGLIRLTAIGFAGLYYYVGILLRVLHERSRYETGEITPVYMAGKDSELLNWLAEGGRFDKNAEFQELLSRMLSKGTAIYDEDDPEGICFKDTGEITRLSQKFEDEVACGLVMKYTDIEIPQGTITNSVIPGEDCELDGEDICWNADLEFEDDVKRLKIPKLERLSRFLYDFHQALRDLDIEAIDRLPDYTRSRDMEDNDRLWRSVRKELNNLLLDIRGDAKNIRVEPPFILGLKALLIVLGKEWAGK